MLLMGKLTISMAIFSCYVSSPEGNLDNWDIIGYNQGFFGGFEVLNGISRLIYSTQKNWAELSFSTKKRGTSDVHLLAEMLVKPASNMVDHSENK